MVLLLLVLARCRSCSAIGLASRLSMLFAESFRPAAAGACSLCWLSESEASPLAAASSLSACSTASFAQSHKQPWHVSRHSCSVANKPQANNSNKPQPKRLYVELSQ